MRERERKRKRKGGGGGLEISLHLFRGKEEANRDNAHKIKSMGPRSQCYCVFFITKMFVFPSKLLD